MHELTQQQEWDAAQYAEKSPSGTIELLSDHIESLAKELEVLSAKLKPVLAPQAPVDVAPRSAVDHLARSPLRVLAARLESEQRQITDLIQRIDL